MSGEEDCDDLPLIKVNSSANDSSSFTMPSAEELACQRARELECERQLQELRELDGGQRPAPLRHSDSSGSEAELALAAAATALSLRERQPGVAAAALWAALAPCLPPAARRLPARRLPRLARALAAAAPDAAPAADVLCAGALLCVLRVSPEARACPAAARALHALLDEHATAAQVAELVRTLLAAFPCPRTRLQLSDALRSGGEAGADRAAAGLAAAALLQLVAGADGAGADVERLAAAAAAWRAEGAAARGAAVVLAGRVLAARGARGAAPARLLAHLAPAPGLAARDPDLLKVTLA